MRTLLVFVLTVFCYGAAYRAGVARLDITPSGPIRLAGYAARQKASEAVAMRLWAKALVIEDKKGARFVFVTTDLIGLPASVSDVVAARAYKEYGVERRRLLLNSSHTHAGPIVWPSGRPDAGLADEQKRILMEYRNALVEQLVSVIGAALKDLTAVDLRYGTGQVRFAVNRRQPTPEGVRIGVNPNGPTDYDVPVIHVVRPDGGSLAILFGYACHNTTLVGDNLVISGDYAGFAQAALEKAFPRSTAMFLALCGGNQNPNPRGKQEHVEAHGSVLATEVARVAKAPGTRLSGSISAAFTLRDLALEQPLTKPIPYPVQAIGFGKSLVVVALGGEVVVEYALQLKREYSKIPMIVAAYSNDVMAYIPTRTMLQEGGYEPVDSMRYYGFPSPLAPDTEERVMQAARDTCRRIGIK